MPTHVDTLTNNNDLVGDIILKFDIGGP